MDRISFTKDFTALMKKYGCQQWIMFLVEDTQGCGGFVRSGNTSIGLRRLHEKFLKVVTEEGARMLEEIIIPISKH